MSLFYLKIFYMRGLSNKVWLTISLAGEENRHGIANYPIQTQSLYRPRLIF